MCISALAGRVGDVAAGSAAMLTDVLSVAHGNSPVCAGSKPIAVPITHHHPPANRLDCSIIVRARLI